MKNILRLMGALALTVGATPSVVACAVIMVQISLIIRN